MNETFDAAAEQPAVVISGVDKFFDGVQALNNLSFSVPTGQITVLLGPNGAGKTTAIRCITGALPPHTGSVQTFGLDPVDHGGEIRARCGVVSAKPALYDRLPGIDNLTFAARLYDVANPKAASMEAAERFGISHALDQYVGGYSTGMKTRLALARAVLHKPDLLILDEPTSGLDPESSQAVLKLIRDFTAEGITVIMCTHLLVEAEGLADQIVMLDEGTLLLNGTQDGLIGQYWPTNVVRFDANNKRDLEMLKTAQGVSGWTRSEFVDIEVDSLDRIPQLLNMLVQAGVEVTRVQPHVPSLEELYFKVRKEHRESKLQDQPQTLAEATQLGTEHPTQLAGAAGRDEHPTQLAGAAGRDEHPTQLAGAAGRDEHPTQLAGAAGRDEPGAQR